MDPKNEIRSMEGVTLFLSRWAWLDGCTGGRGRIAGWTTANARPPQESPRVRQGRGRERLPGPSSRFAGVGWQLWCRASTVRSAAMRRRPGDMGNGRGLFTTRATKRSSLPRAGVRFLRAPSPARAATTGIPMPSTAPHGHSNPPVVAHRLAAAMKGTSLKPEGARGGGSTGDLASGNNATRSVDSGDATPSPNGIEPDWNQRARGRAVRAGARG
ncbi:hypothetical protein JHW43_007671 [Diplocarpon mali]|nr:hypothetical protein JHW43_007671 [Diplocarpon mali]